MEVFHVYKAIFHTTPFERFLGLVFFCTLFSLTAYGTSLATSGHVGPKSGPTVVPLLLG
ncbi:hypothetical protein DFP94_1011077 [Fontibacillus phaseoli]|uniref:Uncharacterized protein n=1 Tax=Fontibacillus phaseoli TaxID=1416533 RepID=A0A369BS26_9BACL|nr:hypothetical protein DFP94_1011077 [Fontibacillus phaseoli]